MSHSLHTTFLACALYSVCATCASADTLAGFARTKRLHRDDATADIVIDNRNLHRASQHGTLTLGGPSPVRGGETASAPRRDNDAARTKWRARHRKQMTLVEKARRTLDDLDAKVAELDRAHFEAGTASRAETRARTRLESAKKQRRRAAEALQKQERRLRSLIRDARADGAVPGWFRD